jgi:hypothetical protein
MRLPPINPPIQSLNLQAPIVDEYTRISEDAISVQNYDSDRGEFKQLAKQPELKSAGFWVVGDSIVVSKRSMPDLEQAQKVFKGQNVSSLDATENAQLSESTNTRNVKRITRWGSNLYGSVV